MPEIRRGGLTISYQVEGAGPTIVLTHSFLCDHTMWRFQIGKLVAAGWQVVAIDMRGHGCSGPATEAFSIYDLADDVVAVLDDVGVDEAVWCGLSIGGMLSVRAALRHPGRVTALVLADSDGGPEEPVTALKYRAMGLIVQLAGPRPLFGTLDPLFFGPVTRAERPELVEDQHDRWEALHRPSILRGVGALVRRDNVLPQASAVEVPALVIVGADDEALPVERSQRLAAALPGADLAIVERAGHLSALEQPDGFNEVLLPFLERVRDR